ncbi:hypothetical protein QWZ08_13790 [Ferruginibacter paludis]|uniref:hypothetical protein n=1 Tax=Ferruginibacter paludis TaxID=1310417 RepID=UPI0025B4FC26|nr:hypothetical protein [Ferruginibacter paludis]MDN3656712.1 hypothetical protein [Ferruginibacter paludis]
MSKIIAVYDSWGNTSALRFLNGILLGKQRCGVDKRGKKIAFKFPTACQPRALLIPMLSFSNYKKATGI